MYLTTTSVTDLYPLFSAHECLQRLLGFPEKINRKKQKEKRTEIAKLVRFQNSSVTKHIGSPVFSHLETMINLNKYRCSQRILSVLYMHIHYNIKFTLKQSILKSSNNA